MGWEGQRLNTQQKKDFDHETIQKITRKDKDQSHVDIKDPVGNGRVRGDCALWRTGHSGPGVFKPARH